MYKILDVLTIWVEFRGLVVNKNDDTSLKYNSFIIIPVKAKYSVC